MSTPVEYTKLTRKDLTVFHSDMRDLVLEAMARGGVGRISNKGHAILRAPDSTATMSVMPKASRNRNLQNCRADFNRMFGHLEPEVKPEPAPTAPTPKVLDKPRPKLECGVRGCEETFVVEGARYAHIQRDHHVCPAPGCTRAFTSVQGASLHFRRTHEGFDPNQKKEPTVKTETAPAAAPMVSDDSELLAQIRKMLGNPSDERVKELEGQLDIATKRIEELENKLTMLREALQ